MSKKPPVVKTHTPLTPCTEELYPKLLRFLDISFKKKSFHWFANNMSHIFRPDPAFIKRTYLHMERGKIAGAIGVYPFSIRIGETQLKTAGVGSVAVHPAMRGQGIMSSMLLQADRLIRESDYDLSWLQGDRFRYRNYGWDFGGKMICFHLYRRDLLRVGKFLDFEKVDLTEDKIEELLNLYSRFENRVERDFDLFKRHLTRKNFDFLAVKTVSGIAYLLFSTRFPERIFELQGDAGTVDSLLSVHMDQQKLEMVEIEYPDVFDTVSSHLKQLSSHFSVHHSFQIKVVNTVSTWKKLIPEAAKRFFPQDKTIIQEMEWVAQQDQQIILDRLLGFFDKREVFPSTIQFLERLEPLNWWIPKLDRV